jgi:CubicO group peptidase (beta-lactamase class C family)
MRFAITRVLEIAIKASPLLVPGCADQDRRFARPFQVLAEGVSSRDFPAAVTAITQGDGLVALKSFGRFTFNADSPSAMPNTIFDLASVSKVVATTAMAMILYDRGWLDLEARVSTIIGEFSGEDPRRDEVTLRMLLGHSSGLPAYEKLFMNAGTRDELLAAAFRVPLVEDPGSCAEYSDVGFIILGVALERLADESLDRFSQREIFGPIGMARTTYNPPPSLHSTIAPTANDQTFRHRIIQGEVQDENASVLGGVAGHAGVFSSAEDVATFAHTILTGGLVRPETTALFTRREISPEGSSRALGWDTPSEPSQSGKYFSTGSFGHLGYTGTSLWIDPQRQLSVTLLTNRTWPDCANQRIKELRPSFHDAVIECLESPS